MSIAIPESVKVWSQFFHPILMWVLLFLSFYAMYLGVKSKKTRLAEGESKKELIKGQFKIRHYQIGSILLAMMVLGSLGGMAVTYINNQKLFVSPHLIVGLNMTGIIAIAASLAPLLQKGIMWARYTHIGLNMILITLFLWQAVTGMDIVQRIISRM